MFCKNCGKELQDGESFCSKCGVKTGETKGIYLNLPDAQDLRGKTDQIKQRVNGLGSQKMVYFATGALLLLSLFLLVKDMFKLSYTMFYETTLTATMFEDAGMVKTLFVIGYLASVCFMLVPFALGRDWEPKYFLGAKFLPIASLAWLLIVIIRAMSEMKNKLGGYGAYAEALKVNVGLTGVAWLFILVSAATVILAFRVSNAVLCDKNAAGKN